MGDERVRKGSGRCLDGGQFPLQETKAKVRLPIRIQGKDARHLRSMWLWYSSTNIRHQIIKKCGGNKNLSKFERIFSVGIMKLVMLSSTFCRNLHTPSYFRI